MLAKVKGSDVPSFALYAGGILAVFLSDVLVSSFFSDDTISEWSEARSLVGISGVLCLLGLDQVLVRSPRSSHRLLSTLVLQVPFLAAPAAGAIYWLGYLDGLTEAYFLAVGSAGTIICYQYFRSHHMRMAAQLVQQFWRVALLTVIVLLIWWPDLVPMLEVVVTVLLLGVVGGSLLIARHPPTALTRQDPEPFGVLYRIGARFMVTSTLLALAVYAEQLLVLRVGTTADSALYFSHATFFLFPMNVINGYLGFLLGPWVRDNHDRFNKLLKRRWPLLLAAVTLTAITMNGIGQVAWHAFSPSVGEVDLRLSLMFALSGIMITLYQLPSAYNGIFARTYHHDILIAAQILALALSLAIFLLLHFTFGSSVIASVAAASLMNWSFRTVSGFVIVALIIRGE